jgi:hypothetical protein
LAQFLVLAALPTAGAPGVPQPAFPADVGGWRLTVGPEVLNMDGEADVYMTYAFRCMHHAVYERDGKALVVEAYDLSSPAEAYGMFTNITTGNPVRLAQAGRYGFGELCFWQGRYFTKIYEQERAQDVRPEIARVAGSILPALGDAGPPSPFITAVLPPSLRPASVRYFHRDANLNNFYYVSTENVLALSDETDCVLADCASGDSAVKVLVIHYPSESVRDKGWAGFCRTIFTGEARGGTGVFQSERVPEGTYTGIKKMRSPCGAPLLGICFEGTSTDQCHSVLGVVESHIARAASEAGAACCSGAQPCPEPCHSHGPCQHHGHP